MDNKFLAISPYFIQNPDMLRKFLQRYRVQRDKNFGVCIMALRREFYVELSCWVILL